MAKQKQNGGAGAQQTIQPPADQQQAPPAAGAGAGGPLAKRKATPLAIADASAYALMALDAQNGSDMSEALAANIGETGQLSAFDFDRIRVPAGGGLAWELVDTATGEVGVAQEFEGIIVAWNDQKSYWKQGLDEKNAVKGPPQCYSTDCIQGHGDPGVKCAACPFNVFGSAKGGSGRGKACKDTRLIFIMRPEDVMPELEIVPPTCLKNVRRYFQFLMSRSIPYYRAVTKLKLSREKNPAGIEYSKIEPSLVAILPPEQAQVSKHFSAQVSRMLGRSTIQVRAEDLRGGEGGAPGDVVEGSIAGASNSPAGVGAGAGAGGDPGGEAGDDDETL